MTDKKLEVRRLIIFLLLALSISWIPAIILNYVFGYREWFETYKMPLLSLPVSYGPAIANILTRKITHEGWHDSMLHLKLKGHIRYYLTAVFIVSVMSIPDNILATIIYGNNDWSDLGRNLKWQEIFSAIMPIFSFAPLMALNTFGEEFGWRGYMNQKMEPLFGTTGTVVTGGIIWGLWHAELTVAGHSFGKDYSGYPYPGILFMCIFCTFTGMILMWLTKKTGSIYPAAIMHAMINFGGKNIGQLFLSGIPDDFSPTISQNLIISIPGFAVCLIFLILMLCDNKKKKAKAA